MARSNRPQLSAVGVAALLFGSSSAFAQGEDTFDRTPTDCISVISITRTEVVDDQTIIFHMRGKPVYRNHLPKSCPGLEREDRFTYQTRNGRLCDSDTITVLEQFGVRLTEGFTCGLGEFHPLTQEELEDVTGDDDPSTPGRNAIETEAVGLPPADGAADDEASPAPAADTAAGENQDLGQAER